MCEQWQNEAMNATVLKIAIDFPSKTNKNIKYYTV